MRNNETGEFELIVGNKQLLSGFFIVVLLFAVAFAMGYVVGQNSPRSAKAAETTASAASAAGDPRPTPAAAAPVRSAAVDPPVAPAADPPSAPAGDSPQPTTQPAREAGGAPAPAPAPADAAKSAEPPAAAPGSYWQVIAIAQADAEVIYRALKDKGFPAYMSPGPNGLVRVLVGPYSDTASMGKAKTDLENAGFPHPFRK